MDISSLFRRIDAATLANSAKIARVASRNPRPQTTQSERASSSDSPPHLSRGHLCGGHARRSGCLRVMSLFAKRSFDTLLVGAHTSGAHRVWAHRV
jgi:hypothetical protein